jgi:drug/metabolite transporter (DMT)-like permease
LIWLGCGLTLIASPNRAWTSSLTVLVVKQTTAILAVHPFFVLLLRHGTRWREELPLSAMAFGAFDVF